MIDLSRAGALGRPDGVGRAGGGACDDRVAFTLGLCADGVVEAVRFGADACPTATATAALLAAAAEGGDLLDAARLGAPPLPDAGRAPCAAVAVDALHAAIGDAVRRGAGVPARAGRVLVAMSGGVDSAVALADAVAAGLEPVGCTLGLWIDPAAPRPERACCAPASVRAARAACHAVGAPHVGLALADAFHAAVVEPFVAGYAAGTTPNPCVRCNGGFRLDVLVDVAARLGADAVWTGHYARTVELDGVPLIARGRDALKDQSYMLAGVRPETTARLVFPRGASTKAETRERARALALAAADAPESQEVCFLGGGDLPGFLARHGVELAPGPVEDEAGAILGTHAGARALTPGQRRGVGVGGGDGPLHVLRVDAARNAVVVAPPERLRTRSVRLADAVLHVPRARADARLRYRSEAIPARLEGVAPGLVLALERAAFAVAPGQTAALYDGDAVIGAGTVAG